ncbi:phosphate/phosphite/phosphonate ABC transporter substrate-binding protein [Vibrio europaeus]|uniref:Phosphate ABC transporter substrate-binding protein n=1 Tax=Vibrio europaeus TaxID=300876 RepID=A0A178JFN6_9VIBR|nr:phosphate/phosphite/phosphonate ABC transporter substrate-binding protein [Vibrio europaeus]MDC5707386.1 phosphate/phosphite/phosphonate ABC transporter substrate-binding protein [Vibrio europaeus]MDC5712751.1 phosphate/phosphite/phosphonate ABC transporter substrate-binding protein [Vibrio europaeus]MDC5717394.1 phosphate/phosphite/phosphonate ABC transporter substrate-binding protein [Vibrio europaeus]MDC5721071.1 phosphate/phosphite/phosphonate ABC transporter substrate-binding protein [V
MRTTILALSTLLLSTATLADTLTFGVVPQQSASRLAKQWGPLVDTLKEQTGYEITFSTAPNIPEFEKRLSEGQYDLAYMNPYHYTVFSQVSGYRAIAKAKDKRIKGIIVARRSNDYQSLEDLQGQTLAFPSPAAFAATVLTQSDLKTADVEFEPDYVSSHDSVYLSVAKGFYPAGGGVMRTFNTLPDVVKSQLVPIWTTKPYTPHAIAYHPRLTNDQANAIQAALVSLQNTSKGGQQLKSLNIKGFEEASDSDWDDVRALNIKILE